MVISSLKHHYPLSEGVCKLGINPLTQSARIVRMFGWGSVVKYFVKAMCELQADLVGWRPGYSYKESIPPSREVVDEFVLIDLGLPGCRKPNIGTEAKTLNVPPLQRECMSQPTTDVEVKPIGIVGHTRVGGACQGRMQIAVHVIPDEVHKQFPIRRRPAAHESGCRRDPSAN